MADVRKEGRAVMDCSECGRPMPDTEFGRLINRKMAKEGLSLREVGTQTGVSFTTISRTQAGKVPTLPTFARLAEWLGLSSKDVQSLLAEFIEVRRPYVRKEKP